MYMGLKPNLNIEILQMLVQKAPMSTNSNGMRTRTRSGPKRFSGPRTLSLLAVMLASRQLSGRCHGNTMQNRQWRCGINNSSRNIWCRSLQPLLGGGSVRLQSPTK